MTIILRKWWVVCVAILAGCGTYATPVFEAPSATPIAVAQANTLRLEPTTELTATMMPTNEPTETTIPTEEPIPTIEPTEEIASSPIDRLVASRDPAEGEVLFNTLQESIGFACSTCHHVDSEQQLIGPGLLNIKGRAETRVEGQVATQYLYNSIINPNAYIVDGFTEGVMPATWTDVYTDPEIFSIVAYLLTLEGESGGETEIASSDDSVTETPSESQIRVLPDTANPENGAVLFETFQSDAGFACSTCHHVDSEDRLIGPGLLNLGSRAESRVDGQDAITYIYQSIVHPSEFVVPEYPDQLMPQNWSDIYSEDEIYDIVSYLITLGNGLSADVSGSDDMAVVTDEVTATVELPETANAENGAILFETFQAEASFACSTCHHVDSEDRLIGPGLLNVVTRAQTRVDGQNAVDYLFTAIINPSEFVVPEYPDQLMPQNWAEVYTEDEIYDLIAYLITLE